MAEIEITLPTVQYGNVRVKATPEELGVDIASPAAVGTATAIYLNLFTQGFKVGASMDVTASPTEGLKAPQGAEQADHLESFSQAVETAHREAQRLLSEGLGGATEIETTSVIEASGIAPWDDSDLKVDAKPKPWETEAATW